MAALQSINSKNAVYPILVQRIRKKIKKIKSKGTLLNLLWVPSNVGIAGNERADVLAKAASQKENIDYNLGLSIKQIRSIIRNKHSLMISDQRQEEYSISRSARWYDWVASQTSYTYGKKTVSRHNETVHARIRLGYHYPWQFTNNKVDCKICSHPEGHTLHHYVMECQSISEFRNNSYHYLEDQAIYLLNSGNINKILKRFNGFASAR